MDQRGFADDKLIANQLKIMSRSRSKKDDVLPVVTKPGGSGLVETFSRASNL